MRYRIVISYAEGVGEKYQDQSGSGFVVPDCHAVVSDEIHEAGAGHALDYAANLAVRGEVDDLYSGLLEGSAFLVIPDEPAKDCYQEVGRYRRVERVNPPCGCCGAETGTSYVAERLPL